MVEIGGPPRLVTKVCFEALSTVFVLQDTHEVTDVGLGQSESLDLGELRVLPIKTNKSKYYIIE